MSRPTTLHVGGTLYWVIQTRDPDTMLLKDADSTPTVAVRKNGSSVGDSVTVTKRSATTGLYDCSYNPAGEAEGDKFTLEESATVTGTTTSSATYSNSFNVNVMAVERGTDGANTTAPATPTNVSDAQTNILAKLPAALTANGNMKCSLLEIISTALSEGATGRIAAAWQKMWNVASSVLTSASVNQTGDNYAYLGTNVGANGANLTAADDAVIAAIAALNNVSAADVLTALGTGSWATSLAQSSVWTATLAASLSPIRSNTAQAGSSNTITLDAGASAVTDFYVPCGIYLTGGTGAGQFRTIDAYNGTTKVADLSEPWYTTPDNTTTFSIRPEGIAHADMRALVGNELSAGYLKSIADYYGLNSKIAAQVEGIATDAITADSVSAAAVTKIQSGLATGSELLLVKDRVSYCLTVLVGACSDAGTSAETYVHAIGGETFTVDYTGLDATGNRTTTTLSKA